MCSLHRLHTYARTVCISSFSKYKFANIMSNISPRNLWIPMQYLQNQNLFSSTVSVWFSLMKSSQSSWNQFSHRSHCFVLSMLGWKQWQKSSSWNLVNTCFLSLLLKSKCPLEKYLSLRKRMLHQIFSLRWHVNSAYQHHLKCDMQTLSNKSRSILHLKLG